MINWWREDLYLDWLEVTTLTIVIGLVVVCVVYDIVMRRKGKKKRSKDESKRKEA